MDFPLGKKQGGGRGPAHLMTDYLKHTLPTYTTNKNPTHRMMLQLIWEVIFCLIHHIQTSENTHSGTNGVNKYSTVLVPVPHTINNYSTVLVTVPLKLIITVLVPVPLNINSCSTVLVPVHKITVQVLGPLFSSSNKVLEQH